MAPDQHLTHGRLPLLLGHHLNRAPDTDHLRHREVEAGAGTEATIQLQSSPKQRERSTILHLSRTKSDSQGLSVSGTKRENGTEPLPDRKLEPDQYRAEEGMLQRLRRKKQETHSASTSTQKHDRRHERLQRNATNKHDVTWREHENESELWSANMHRWNVNA
ncbi:hypothetical protein LTR60_002928 [Cryomyces antarcticus]|nr:hypothetical protein LTR60_002928 [Cryomyces antarcticus]